MKLKMINGFFIGMCILIMLLIGIFYGFVMLLTMPDPPRVSLLLQDRDEYRVQRDSYCEAKRTWCRFDVFNYLDDAEYCDYWALCDLEIPGGLRQ